LVPKYGTNAGRSLRSLVDIADISIYRISSAWLRQSSKIIQAQISSNLYLRPISVLMANISTAA
jgi:hypothetical protein